MPVHVGTSGWQYDDWRGRFYPQGLPKRLWLEHHAGAFATVEVNNAFYRLPGLADTWEDRQDAFAHLNNDPGGAAVRDAVVLGAALRARGRTTSRLPRT